MNLGYLWDIQVRVSHEAAGEVGLNNPKIGVRSWRLTSILFYLVVVESDSFPKLGHKISNMLSTVPVAD